MTFPGYHPMGYTPSQRPDPPSDISAGQRLLAKRAGASHIAGDGAFCYCWRYGKVERAIWYENHYGGWWQDGELMPPGVVTV